MNEKISSKLLRKMKTKDKEKMVVYRGEKKQQMKINRKYNYHNYHNFPQPLWGPKQYLPIYH